MGMSFLVPPGVALLCCFVGSAQGSNPVVVNTSIADPHIHIFDGKAYMYAGRDVDPHARGFDMPDWHIRSSTDLVNWVHEHTIYPTETYIGNSSTCWAVDVGYNGKDYFFYFSNGGTDFGVMRATTPTLADAVDILHKPLVTSAQVDGKTHPYDPTVLRDDDGTQYIVFGLHEATTSYMISKLDTDTMLLAEEPKVIVFQPSTETNLSMPYGDKPTLHKWNGTYYLSSGTLYSTATDVYGPYTFRGDTGTERPTKDYGETGQAHGRYFTWNNQWFHVWCEFISQNNTVATDSEEDHPKNYYRYRDSWMTYTHYRASGEMVDDIRFLDQDSGRLGVGQYDARWSTLSASWYMRASAHATKVELQSTVHDMNTSNAQFGVRFDEPQAQITFPNVYFVATGNLSLGMESCAGSHVVLDFSVVHNNATTPLGQYRCDRMHTSPFEATIAQAPHALYDRVDVAVTYLSDTTSHVQPAVPPIVLDWIRFDMDVSGELR